MTEEQQGPTLRCLCKEGDRLIGTNQTSLATNQRVVVGCKKNVAERREQFYSLQQNLYLLGVFTGLRQMFCSK